MRRETDRRSAHADAWVIDAGRELIDSIRDSATILPDSSPVLLSYSRLDSYRENFSHEMNTMRKDLADADAVWNRLRKVDVAPWCPPEVAAMPPYASLCARSIFPETAPSSSATHSSNGPLPKHFDARVHPFLPHASAFAASPSHLPGWLSLKTPTRSIPFLQSTILKVAPSTRRCSRSTCGWPPAATMSISARPSAFASRKASRRPTWSHLRSSILNRVRGRSLWST